jgi:hypothetical protein
VNLERLVVFLGPGNTDSFQLGACRAYAAWRGAPAKVLIAIKHR